ncbi:MAG: UDP-N-acetylglucosamine 1-carboxyvinyltransferase, partial [Patescibacteria group bacterium]
KKISAFDIKTREYPGFPTDLQAPFVILLTQAWGQSTVFETVFDGRLNYIDDLNRMGAHITPGDPHRILVDGPSRLRGREIESPDLRAGLAFVIAALAARGKSVVRNIYQIDRGYERIEERLSAVGARITREEADGKN